MNIGHFDSIESGSDELGFYILIGATDNVVSFRMGTYDLAAFDAALQPLRDWQAEGERQRAAYTWASDAERAEVLGLQHDEGLDPADPKSPNYYERMVGDA